MTVIMTVTQTQTVQPQGSKSLLGTEETPNPPRKECPKSHVLNHDIIATSLTRPQPQLQATTNQRKKAP